MIQEVKKFALIGTSCVGKTTLLELLQKRLRSENPTRKIVSIPEAARIYFSQYTIRKTAFLYLHQRRIQELARYQEQQALKQNPDILLCDRSVLDAIVWVKTMDNHKKANQLLGTMAAWLTTYTHFFLLDPTSIPYKADEIRRESKRERNAFHKTFLEILSQTNLPYTLISGTKKHRLDKITQDIYNYLT